ncbi:Methyltransferase type 11 [Ketogulonicigenium robustum]|uniref:Methyltransferase type 11 n=1 Tax=Ketogulonicigenium robustum TaxID=92947 RepID=A0A1W6NXU3_9RHOB|nr:class I SAM-dependent methyltransferase [Ketogulonicigenium robustum]ARO14065.1 Methyltransferase type 11 [Ketogulonicigenium robustum]
MYLDVQDLKNFYYRNALGRAVQQVVRGRLRHIWPDTRSMTVAGFGFALPLLRPFLPEARRVIGLMPGPQGVMAWPPGLPNIALLCEELDWPLETGSVDRLVMLHGLEMSERQSDLLEETHRVLGPGGRAVFVVPNRAGLWARYDKTPFGFGKPYTLGQLEGLLKEHDFVIETAFTALYQPPSLRPLWRRFGQMIERVGTRTPAIYAGGVLMVEVTKAPVALPRPRVGAARAARNLRILSPAGSPVSSPAALRARPDARRSTQ